MVASPKGLGPEKTALARASSMYKRQTCSLVKESTPQKYDYNCQTVINIWSWAPDGAWHQDLLTDWQSVATWLWLWLKYLTELGWRVKSQLPVGHSHEEFIVEEELDVSLWRLNEWFEDFMCAVVQWYLECEHYSSCIKICCWERIGKILSRLSFCWDLLPSNDKCKQM
jgi:hypothetical protein